MNCSKISFLLTTFFLIVCLCQNLNGFPAKDLIWKNQPQCILVNEDFQFIYQQNQWSKITVIHFLVKGGKAAVPLSKRGVAFISNRLAVEFPSGDGLRELMHLGSTLRTGVHGNYTTITIMSLSENLEETLKIVSKIIKKPLLSSLRVSNLKRFMAHREKSETDSPEQMMELTCLNAFMDDKPESYGYGGSTYGSKKSRKNIKRKDVVNFHKQFFNAGNMVISVSSDLTGKEMTRLMELYFLWPQPKVKDTEKNIQPAQLRLRSPKEKQFTLHKDNQQVLIAMCAQLPPISRENFVYIAMLDNMLGKGIGSKLWPLRSEKDLAYTLNTYFMQMKEAGFFYIYLKTEKEKKDLAYAEFKKLLANFYHSGISDDELLTAKVRSKADFLRNSENKAQLTEKLSYFEALGLGFDFIEEFFNQVDAVTGEKFNAYMKKVLKPGTLLEITIGPERDK